MDNSIVAPSACTQHPHEFGLPVLFDNIPLELQQIGLWCVWKAELIVDKYGDDKLTKVPYSTIGRVSTKKKALWMKFDDARELYNASNNNSGKLSYNGIGILVNGFIGVDIDKSLDLGIWKTIACYKEFSPSGKGVRMFGSGWTDSDLCCKTIEIYSGNSPRFLTVTGNIIDNGDNGEASLSSSSSLSSSLLDIGDYCDQIIKQYKATHSPGVDKIAGVVDVDKIVKASELSIDNSPAGLTRDYAAIVEYCDKNDIVIPRFKFKVNDDRSERLYGWSLRLLKSGLTEVQVLVVYTQSKAIIEMAKSHRSDHLEYLWSDINRAQIEVNGDKYLQSHEFDQFVDSCIAEGDVDEGSGAVDKVINHQGLIALEKTFFALCKKLKMSQLGEAVVRNLYIRVCYSDAKGKFFVINHHDNLNSYSQKNYIECELLQGKIFVLSGGDTSEVFEKALVRVFIRYVTRYRQIKSMRKSVDMFAQGAVMTIDSHDVCSHVSTFKGFGDYGSRVDADLDVEGILCEYKDYFKLLDAFIDYIACCRFASSRRQGSLWFHAPSNWGKGFLMSALKELGIVLEVTETQIEKALEGAPVNINMDGIENCWIMYVDEFAVVKSEIKLLDNEFRASSKHQLQVTAPIYAKIFMSAEDVRSLNGDTGIERQFINRFSYFNNLVGDIEKLPLFKSVGGYDYLKVLAEYVGDRLQGAVDEYVTLGRDKACRLANTRLGRFHQEYSIGLAFEGVDESFDEYAADLMSMISDVHRFYVDVSVLVNNCSAAKRDVYLLILDNMVLFDGDSNSDSDSDSVACCVKRPKRIITQYLGYIGGRFEGKKLAYKAIDVLGMLDIGKIKVKRATINGILLNQ